MKNISLDQLLNQIIIVLDHEMVTLSPHEDYFTQADDVSTLHKTFPRDRYKIKATSESHKRNNSGVWP